MVVRISHNYLVLTRTENNWRFKPQKIKKMFKLTIPIIPDQEINEDRKYLVSATGKCPKKPYTAHRLLAMMWFFEQKRVIQKAPCWWKELYVRTYAHVSARILQVIYGTAETIAVNLYANFYIKIWQWIINR